MTQHDVSTLEGLVASAQEWMEKRYRENTDPGFDTTAQFLYYSPAQKGVGIMITPFVGQNMAEVERCKNNMLLMARVQFFKEDVTHYLQISEAWVIQRDAENPDDGRAPSECEDRKEVLHILGTDKSGRVLGATYDIQRDEEGCPRLGEAQPVDRGTFSGRMLSLLNNPDHMHDHLRRLADAL